MKKYDVGSALFLLAFGLLAVFEARKLTLGTLGRPGPGFFPFYLGVAMCLVALGLAARGAWARGGEVAAGPVPGEQPAGPGRRQWSKVLYTLLGLLVYAFILEPIGFPAASVLLMLFLFRVIEPQRWSVAVVTSLGTALGAYGLFKWLGVRLPPGRWPF